MNIVEKIKLHYPLPIAKLHEEMRLETMSPVRIYKLINLFEGTVQYMVLLGMSYYRHQQLVDADIEKLRAGLSRPSLGHWVKLLRGLSKCLRPSDPHFLTADPMHDYKDQPIGTAVVLLRETLGMDPLKKIQLHHFLDTMVEFRNKKRGHGELPTAEAERLRQPLEAALNQWLDELSILHERNLLYLSVIRLVKGQHVYTGTQLNMGTSPDAFQAEGTKGLEDECVYLYQPGSDTYIPLWPFVAYDPDSQVLYTYHELTDDGKVHLRRLYSARGSAEWTTMENADKSLVIGESPSQEQSTPTEASDSQSVEATPEPSQSQSETIVIPESPASSAVNEKTSFSAEQVAPSKVDVADKELIVQTIKSLKKTWFDLQKKIDTLMEESVHATTETQMRLDGEIKKTKNRQEEIRAQLQDAYSQLDAAEKGQSQRVTLQAKHQEDTDQTIKAFSLLSRMAQQPEVLVVLVKSRNDFEYARKHINIVRDYKNIHDALHELEINCYRVISAEASRFPSKGASGDLSIYLVILSDIKNRIKATVERGFIPWTEGPLLDRLEDAEKTLNEALTTRERKIFNKAVGDIGHILRFNLSRINHRLIDSASSLSLPDLIEGMEQVQSQLVRYGSDPGEIQAIEKGIQSLRNLDRSLSTRTQEHNEWQEINDELKLAESDLFTAIEQWTHTKERIDNLCSGSTEIWSLSIRKCCEQLDSALGNKETNKNVKEIFRSLNRAVVVRFQQVDGYLKDFYDQVKTLDEPITSIMHQIM